MLGFLGTLWLSEHRGGTGGQTRSTLGSFDPKLLGKLSSCPDAWFFSFYTVLADMCLLLTIGGF